MRVRPLHDVYNCVDWNHHKRVDKGDDHPDINPLDVECGGQGVEHVNEERGQGHQDSCVDGNDAFKTFMSDKVVGQLVDQHCSKFDVFIWTV